MVQVHVTADLPIRSRALPFANRVEVRFGKAFPVALLVDEEALVRLGAAIEAAKVELRDASGQESAEG
ncbi:hypothetical protein DI005_14935 [Prauserella sp. PE36]|nr:hypothetical protein DI005_14935 [Prauserella sp. PE36]